MMTDGDAQRFTEVSHRTALAYVIPIALILGLFGLIAFIWSMKTHQFDDPDGDARRILEDHDKPL